MPTESDKRIGRVGLDAIRGPEVDRELARRKKKRRKK